MQTAMKRIVFFYRGMSIGGCEQLIRTIACQLSMGFCRVMVICDYIDADIEKDLNKATVDIRKLGSDWKNDKILESILYEKTYKNNIVSFKWDDYCRLYHVKRSSDKLIFYVVHFDALKIIGNTSSTFLRWLRKKYYAPVIKKLGKSNAIVAMDELCLEHTKLYYGFDEFIVKIVRVSVSLSKEGISLDNIEKKFLVKQKNILAIARAEFPFKGYLLGLIRLMNSGVLPVNYNLYIVSYGEDECLLKEEFEKCSDAVKNRIFLLGKTRYDDLKSLFKKAHVYVGMGTTLIDAVKQGVIAIPVASYTENVECDVFFHENIKLLTAYRGSPRKIVELLQTLSKYDCGEIKEIISIGYNLIYSNYSAAENAKKLLYVFDDYLDVKDVRIWLFYEIRRIMGTLRSIK